VYAVGRALDDSPTDLLVMQPAAGQPSPNDGYDWPAQVTCATFVAEVSLPT
jgi:hypothetical protein